MRSIGTAANIKMPFLLILGLSTAALKKVRSIGRSIGLSVGNLELYKDVFYSLLGLTSAASKHNVHTVLRGEKTLDLLGIESWSEYKIYGTLIFQSKLQEISTLVINQLRVLPVDFWKKFLESLCDSRFRRSRSLGVVYE